MMLFILEIYLLLVLMEYYKMPVDHEYNVCQAAKKQKRKWIHYCPEWDYMCIWKGTPEFDA